MIADQSFVAWKAIISVLYGLGVGTSVARLAFRQFKSKNLWKDDWFAFPLPVLATILAVVIWPLYQERDSHDEIPRQKAQYWLMSLSWLLALWCTRIGLSITLSRQAPPKNSARNTGFRVAVFFAVLLVGSLAWSITMGCEHYSRLRKKARSVAYCNGGKEEFSIANFVATFLSAIVLIGTSLWFRFKKSSDLSVSQIRNFTSVLAISVVLLLGTIVHAALYFSPLVRGTNSLVVIDMAAHFELVLSIIGFNVPTLIAIFDWFTYGQDRQTNRNSNASSLPPSKNIIQLANLSEQRSSKELDDDASSISTVDSKARRAVV
ncbi:hypothetical protein CC2G_004239 [Coprinopsis cinerea AmutBmut pab1-1]|nr:hypothetical protein CC2G_004239 [Coprinopsis cinerea AmutBmut pab1-1]